MKMKRNLIALAVGAAVATPAVSIAEVTAYGQAQVEISSIGYEDEATAIGIGNNATTEDGISVDDFARGRIGLKASEDLGNGWTGLAKFEYKTDTSTSDGVSGRESMVGLKNSAVTIALGTLKQPYKYTGGVKYDPFVATILEARGNGGMSKPGSDATAIGIPTGIGNSTLNTFGHNGFASRVIGVANNSGPVKVQFGYGPSEGDGSYSASVSFSQDAFEVFAATNSTTDLGDPAEFSGMKFGGMFKTGALTLHLQIESNNYDNGAGSDEDIDYMYLNANFKMGKNTFVGSFGTMESDFGDAEWTFMRVGAIHKFTKTTRIFGGFRSTDTDGADLKEDVISVGLRKDF